VARYLLASLVILASVIVTIATPSSVVESWSMALYAAAAVLAVAVGWRRPLTGFVAAVLLMVFTHGGFVVLGWAAYQAGRGVLSRRGTALLTGVAIGGLGAELARPVRSESIGQLLTTYLVLVALPIVVGRYLTQHRRLVEMLDRGNRQLREQRELFAARERLSERLRIARDMHDSLGHRLSLVTVQAAALEVARLPAPHDEAVHRLGQAARGAMTELYELVGALRAHAETPPAPDGADIAHVVEEFRTAGLAVSFHENGERRPLSEASAHAAFRVVEEALTNATKHARGAAVTVSLRWEVDTLLVTVVNAAGDDPAPGARGHGLLGLSERVDSVGGLLDHRRRDGEFRLSAMLPTVADERSPADNEPAIGRARAFSLGVAAAALTLIVLPASLLVGIR
jgi:signal transduction histidine kinase